MEIKTVNGFYGSDNTPCKVFFYEGWYCVEDSVNVNFTHDEVIEGISVEEINDLDCFTWSKPIESIEELEEAVKA